MDSEEVYGRLNPSRREIRLLRLLPGTWEEPLRCDLHVVSLEDQPTYKALSYAWGKLEISRTVRLCGQPFETTVSLWSALRYLRRSNQERLVWADATCINQKDLEERSHQVALMGEIYSKASEVLIWLGDCVDDDLPHFSPDIIEYDKEINSLRENTAQLSECSTSPGHGRDAVVALETLSLLALDEHWTDKAVFVTDDEGRYHIAENYVVAWQATLKLLRLPWWTRIWVVQEAVLAKKATLIVGSVSAPWTLISDFCQSYLKHLPPGGCCHTSATWKMSSDVWDDIVLMRLTFWSFYTSKTEIVQPQSKHPARAFWEFLWHLRHKEATDPRDKVYGLLGLLRNHQYPFLIPDYSVNTAETFSRCTEALIRSENSLSALIGPRLRQPGLPTWVIDLLPNDDSGSLLFFQNLFRRISSSAIFNACGTQELRFSIHRNKLSLFGVQVEKVKEVTMACEEGLVAQTFKEWENLCHIASEHQNTTYPSGCTRADAFWRTMIRDTIRDYQDGEKIRRAATTDEPCYTRFRSWLTDQQLDSKNGSTGSNLMAHPDFCNFRKSFFIATQYQCFFTTYKGYMGLCDQPQPNDEIWILFGGSVPFIVRPYPDESEDAGSYSLVGDCYVHGIMDGEAVEALGEMKAQGICLV